MGATNLGGVLGQRPRQMRCLKETYVEFRAFLGEQHCLRASTATQELVATSSGDQALGGS